ncbi:outer membrane protein [Legionella brunensis]|uniref:Outer membrane protein beta-barrel domain-containing protein n=1 Tax=Legionella brunensis TaxID=29422 RepID=A0A0W0S3C5_9GAMM|nr:outer membrane beta-barrel protein [Legionella brunensis]KTC77987.1 hypothetical protein Lbru_2279 [Legionella brunensis]
MIKRYIGLVAVSFACYSMGGTTAYSHALQTSLYGGISRTHIDPGPLHISESETDILHSDNDSEGTIGIGLGWQFNLLNQNNTHGLLGGFIAGLNYFHFSAEPGGEVWLYGMPQFVNYDYQFSLDTDRLLVNGQMELFPALQVIQPYVEAGVGYAHIRSQYCELPTLGSGATDGNLIFPRRSDNQWVYTLGAGVKTQLSPQWTLSLAYNFTDFGTIHAGPYDSDVVIQQPLDIAMKLHTALLGITYQWA